MTTPPPTFSIIMGNYNYGHYIGQAIDSVLSQTIKDFELIIVDDGSKDDSRAVIDGYSDPRIKKVYKENGGQASAFNAGFAASEGRLITFLDSDDWWASNKLEVLTKWDEFLGESYGILQHNVEVAAPDSRRPLRKTMPSGDCFAEMTGRGRMESLFVPTSAICIKREILGEVMPMPEDFRIAADAFLVRTVPYFGRTYSIPDMLGFYRVHNNAVFSNSSFDHWDFNSRILIPNLNRFYKSANIDARIDYKKILDAHFPAEAGIGKLAKQLVHAVLLKFGLFGVFPFLGRIFKNKETGRWLAENEEYVRLVRKHRAEFPEVMARYSKDSPGE